MSGGRDHTRIRGKNECVLVLIFYHLGSPPHTREELKNVKEWAELARITPAYAGRMSHWDIIVSTRQDHPRIRGKNLH